MRNSSNKSSPETLLGVYKKLYRFYGPQHWWPADTRFEMMVGAVLTQNTAWVNVEKAIASLKSEGLLAFPSKIRDINIRKLSRLIRPAGYYNIQAGRIKNLADMLVQRYGGSLKRLDRVPTSRLKNELMAVNGVGPETCDSILLYAFRRPVFVVDAYTKRIFSRHGLFRHDLAYERIQELLMSNLPSEECIFNEYHALIVRLAKDRCRTRPQCGGCPLEGREISCKRLAVII